MKTRRSARAGTAALFALALACGEENAPSVAETGGSGASGPAGAGNAGSSGNDGTSAGGTTSTGGTTTTGGAVSTGGTTSTGGANGGTAGASGSSGAGGSAGSGGSTTRPYKGVANSECADLTRLNVAWWYNWTLSPGDCPKDEFVPMISGKNEKTEVAVANALGSVADAGYDTVLAFNEPNKADQSNLSVSEVLALWPAITSNTVIRVGSPATSADAKAWFEEFMQGVEEQGLRVDFVAIHWYGWNAGSCDDAGELESYVTWAEKFDRPIWITEWGCMHESNPNAEVVKNFYSAAIAMFEKHPSIERYAWYPWNTHNGLVEGGELTALGQTLAAAPASR